MGLLVPPCSLQSLFQVFFSWSFNFQMMRLISFPLTSYYAFQTFVREAFIEFFLSKNSPVLNFILPEYTSLSSFKYFAVAFLVLAFRLL